MAGEFENVDVVMMYDPWDGDIVVLAITSDEEVIKYEITEPDGLLNHPILSDISLIVALCGAVKNPSLIPQFLIPFIALAFNEMVSACACPARSAEKNIADR